MKKMFKQLLHITAFTLIVFLYSCASDSMHENEATFSTSKEIDQLEEQYGATESNNEENLLPESLTDEQQDAYQLRAKQKFQDYLDYLKIVSNPKIDKGLAKHSEKLMKELFVSDTITFASDTIISEAKVNTSIFLVPLELDSVGKSFLGKLQVEMVINKNPNTKTIDVYLVETTKQFADEEQKTIEIKLGNIY